MLGTKVQHVQHEPHRCSRLWPPHRRCTCGSSLGIVHPLRRCPGETEASPRRCQVSAGAAAKDGAAPVKACPLPAETRRGATRSPPSPVWGVRPARERPTRSRGLPALRSAAPWAPGARPGACVCLGGARRPQNTSGGAISDGWNECLTCVYSNPSVCRTFGRERNRASAVRRILVKKLAILFQIAYIPEPWGSVELKWM
jgi:hypothetical protein